MRIIVLGSPGVGKGTYTQELVKRINLPHISTGDLFRMHIKQKSDLGKQVQIYLDSGDLVPDELVIFMVEKRLAQEDCQKGYVLDGFPRTFAQAEALAKVTNLDIAIHFIADDQIVIDRLSGRIICKSCNRIFHEKNIVPKQEGICDDCGGELYRREDDKPDVIKDRIIRYREKVAPLISYYQQKGILKELLINEDFGEHKEAIMAKIQEVLNLNKLK